MSQFAERRSSRTESPAPSAPGRVFVFRSETVSCSIFPCPGGSLVYLTPAGGSNLSILDVPGMTRTDTPEIDITPSDVAIFQ